MSRLWVCFDFQSDYSHSIIPRSTPHPHGALMVHFMVTNHKFQKYFQKTALRLTHNCQQYSQQTGCLESVEQKNYRNLLIIWWPGEESNHRHRDFQSDLINKRQQRITTNSNQFIQLHIFYCCSLMSFIAVICR